LNLIKDKIQSRISHARLDAENISFFKKRKKKKKPQPFLAVGTPPSCLPGLRVWCYLNQGYKKPSRGLFSNENRFPNQSAFCNISHWRRIQGSSIKPVAPEE
jgi:hypothetical protein